MTDSRNLAVGLKCGVIVVANRTLGTANPMVRMCIRLTSTTDFLF